MFRCVKRISIRTLHQFLCDYRLFGVLILSYLILYSSTAYATGYTLWDASTNQDIPIVVEVEITPDACHLWKTADDPVDNQIKQHHLIGLSSEGPDLQVQVTASYVGTNEGHITSYQPPEIGNPFSNSWEPGAPEWGAISYRLTIPREELRPTHANDYLRTFSLWLSGSVGYTEKISTGENTYQWVNSTGSVADELVLAQQLQLSASINRFQHTVRIAVAEICGINPSDAYPLVRQTDDVKTEFIDPGPFSLSFDRIDDNKLYTYFILAPLTSDVDEYGYINGDVTVSACKDGISGDLAYKLPLGFAIAGDMTGIAPRIMSREDAIMDPRYVTNGEALFPGDTIEVNNGGLRIHFCDGQSAWIAAKHATRIVLGTRHGIESERSAISLWLTDAAYDVQDDPRKYARVAISFGLSKALANAVFPVVGIGTWIINKAAGSGANFAIRRATGSASLKSALQSKTTQDISTDPLSSQDFYAVINLLPDDKVMFNQVKGMATLDINGVTQPYLPEGSRSVGDLADTSPILSNFSSDVYNLSNLGVGLSAHWAPVNGTTIHERMPLLSLNYDSPLYTSDCPVNPDYAEIRLNNRLLTENVAVGNNSIQFNVPLSMALHAGDNLLEGFLLEANRSYRHFIQSDLIVDEDAFASPPENLVAYASIADKKTVLRWTPNEYPDVAGYNIERGETSVGPFEALNPAPYPHAIWVDDWADESTSDFYYRVQTVYNEGQTSNWSDCDQMEETANTTDTQPASPTEADVANDADENLISFNDNWPKTIFWKVERGTSDAGPWADLFPEQYIAHTGFRDDQLLSGVPYWYRLSALDIFGNESLPVIIGPVAWDGAPPSPEGLSCYIEGDTAGLRWNPMTTNDISGFKIYRDAGYGYQFIAHVPDDSFIYSDVLPGNGNYRWMVKSVNSDGLESAEGAESPSYKWVLAGSSGTINLGTPSVETINGEQVMSVTATRTQGASGAIFATAILQLESDTGGEFVSRYGGTLVFNDRELTKVLTTKIDNGYHYLSIKLSGIFGESVKDILYGDINQDGTVDIADAVIALQVVSGGHFSSGMSRIAEINGDAKIGLEEAVYILHEISTP